MNFSDKKLIFNKLNKKGFHPQHVAEVGVYYPETSNVYDYVIQGVKATLVEPNPDSIQRIKKHFQTFKNVTLHEVAVFDNSKKVKLINRQASTFLSTLDAAPAIINDQYQIDDSDSFEVDAVTFDTIDDGSIDLLSIDIEGSEWYVIKNLVSRPAIISIETHGALYRNPNMDKIRAWMDVNDYQIWYKDRSDSIFVRKGVFDITLIDRACYLLHEIYLGFRILKKNLHKKFK